MLAVQVTPLDVYVDQDRHPSYASSLSLFLLSYPPRYSLELRNDIAQRNQKLKKKLVAFVPKFGIRFILLQNRQGKTRLAKYYVPLEDSEKHKVEYEVHRLVVNRDPKFTNFVEFRTHKVIYRRYAGLFFSLCVDITDNELAYLECIHLFVEILDHFFSNVCELDLVFNFHKVYLILDEFILAGELQETSKKAIIERMGELEKLEGRVMLASVAKVRAPILLCEPTVLLNAFRGDLSIPLQFYRCLT
ncbi:hypothetical protein DVH24_020121 [Malus domestica]|uniref:AP-2 complex subunit sigma n=1 Tax=Malus domestica TaxID=3750 RepID=A0A498J613_MALDO|nr:hypothetical protein DVH24_020121 [Malus domestica]